MKLVCLGLPLAPLLLLKDGHTIDLVVLSPVAGPGRRRLVRGVGASRVRDAESIGDVTRHLAEADLLVSWFWTRRIPASWLDLAKHGAIGAHPSLLPRHRGPNPYFWAIDMDDEVTGVTVHHLTPEYDRGGCLLQARVPILGRDSWQLARALDRPSLRLLREAVRVIERGTADPHPQDETHATWAPEPSGDLLRVDWHWPTERVLRRIRALAPVPGLALSMADERFFVTRARPAEPHPAALLPGEAGITRTAPRQVVIHTGDGAIAIERATCVLPESNDEVAMDGAQLATRLAARLETTYPSPVLAPEHDPSES